MPRIPANIAVLAGAALLAVAALGPPARAEDDPTRSTDKCIACHSNPDYLVTNKKLYDYFQDWRSSVHGLEGVTCTDCHGGDSGVSTKERAHATRLVANKNGDAVSYERVPETCGACHEELLASYRSSHHFRLVKARGESGPGPNCVTCHGSLNAAALNVRTVGATCHLCHSEESSNHPEVPARAEMLLNDFNTIRGFRLYVSKRGKGEARDLALSEIDAGLSTLSRHWHTFDLAAIESSTQSLLATAKEKYEAVREARKKKPAAGG